LLLLIEPVKPEVENYSIIECLTQKL
jgi:hypothetical protein